VIGVAAPDAEFVDDKWLRWVWMKGDKGQRRSIRRDRKSA